MSTAGDLLGWLRRAPLAFPATVAPAAIGGRRLVAGDGQRTAAMLGLAAALCARVPGSRLRLNRNRSTMLSLRGRAGGSVVSLHVGMLDHPAALAELPEWVARNGRARCPGLTAAMQVVWAGQRLADPVVAALQPFALEPLDGPLDLTGLFDHVHGSWFAHLPRPAIAWARASARRALSHIRFGSYRRRPQPLILINPRLDQPWVSRVFVEHVLHHELCHHAQHCAPLRGEPPHSARFRGWERGFPRLDEALAWERANLARMLAKPG